MAIHEVVLDPEGDVLVIVPGTYPEEHAKDPDPLTPKSSGSEPEEAKPAPEEAPAEEQPSASAEPPPEESSWHFKASSKHLALASSYVKKMRTGTWHEVNEVHDDGLLHWNFEGFDVHAIAIILRIIHGLNRQVQRAVDLGMLAQVSRVVDYLDCHEAVELYASIWVAHLDRLAPPPPPRHADWDSWISVTGVFQNPDIFRRWTRVAIVEKLNCPPSLDLPLLSQAYDTIDERRQEHLDKIMACIYSHIDRLSEQKTCSPECDAILLGTLLRQLHANSLSSLRPTRPYEGLSIGSVVKTVRGLTVPEWYSKVSPVDESAPNPFDFWGASRKQSKLQQRRARLKAKKKASSSDEWSFDAAREAEEMEEVLVHEHTCGFDDLIATVNKLEAEIQGLDLEADLGIRQVE